MVSINRTEKYYGKSLKPIGEELTLSHLLRHKNSFIGMPYGDRIIKALSEKKLIRKNMRVLEVGFGLGNIAKAFSQIEDIIYIGLDCSKNLAKECISKISGDERFNFILADILKPPFLDKKFDLIICNEVLADLPTVVDMHKNAKQTKELSKEDREIYKDALRMLKEYSLVDKKTPETFNFNYGAVRFIEIVKGLLNEKGACLIIENSCENKTKYATQWPARMGMIGHDEYNVKFSWLVKVGKKLGFSVEYGSITDLFCIKKKKFICVLLNEQLRDLYSFYKRNEIDNFLVKYASYIFTPDEFLKLIKEEGFFSDKDFEMYNAFLKRNARYITEITDQFMYIILRKRA